MKRIPLTQDLVNKHFVPGTRIEEGWTLVNTALDAEREHRAVIGVLEVLAGQHQSGQPLQSGVFQAEYAYDHKAGYKTYIGKFGMMVSRKTKTIQVLNLITPDQL